PARGARTPDRVRVRAVRDVAAAGLGLRRRPGHRAAEPGCGRLLGGRGAARGGIRVQRPVPPHHPRTPRPAPRTAGYRRLPGGLMAARILVVTAVPQERQAIAARLGGTRTDRSGRYLRWLAEVGAGEVAVTSCGVGAAAAAAGTAIMLSQGAYDLAVCAGIGGAFGTRAAVGGVVVADRIVHADLGAESPS